MRTIKYIIVHCTDGHTTDTVETLWRVFRQRGWKHAGYHYAITGDGKIHQLEEESSVANGARGYNQRGIHVAWVGGYKGGMPTEAQAKSLHMMIKNLRHRYPEAKVMGHCEVNKSKQCPLIDINQLPNIVPL